MRAFGKLKNHDISKNIAIFLRILIFQKTLFGKKIFRKILDNLFTIFTTQRTENCLCWLTSRYAWFVNTSAEHNREKHTIYIAMFSPSGSPFKKGSTDAKSAQKKQSVIKTVTATFLKLMISWRQDALQIEILLGNLQLLISKLESIQRMERRLPKSFPLLEALFPDAHSLLTGKIYEEVEAVYHQLKSYM